MTHRCQLAAVLPRPTQRYGVGEEHVAATGSCVLGKTGTSICLDRLSLRMSWLYEWCRHEYSMFHPKALKRRCLGSLPVHFEVRLMSTSMLLLLLLGL